MDDQSEVLKGLSDPAFCQRVTGYLEGESSPDELRVLDAELQAEPSKRGAFVRMCLVRVALIRQGLATRVEQPTVSDDGPLDDAMILPALREVEDGVPTSQPTPYSALRIAPVVDRRGPFAVWWAYGAGVAALLAIGFGIHWALRPTQPIQSTQVAVGPSPITKPDEVPPPLVPAPRPLPPPAVVTATAGVEVSGPEPLLPRMTLASGRSIRLTAGAAELTFASGATVLVRAPADVRVVDRDRLIVLAGAVYAHVPPEARGFRVTAPGLDVVDRGTNFGVRTGTKGASTEVHVFEGLVEATGVDTAGRPTSAAVRVTTGEAVSHAEGGTEAQPVTVPFAPVGFDRNIADIRLPITVHGSGAGIAPGAADPNWRLVSMPGKPDDPFRQAIVLVNPRGEYAKNRPDACWIAPTARLVHAAAGEYVYRTTVDLTGYNIASISVSAVMAADDGISEIRVNGKSALVPQSTLEKATWRTLAEVDFAGVPWVSGPNQLEVVVKNSAVGIMNPTGLLFGWAVTASPVVRR